MGSPGVIHSDIRLRVQESVHRLWFSIQEYVQRFDPTASPSDFTDRIAKRLVNRIEDHSDDAEIDTAVQNTVRVLVHEDRRNAQRRAPFWRTLSDSNGVADSQSLDFANRIEMESQMQFLRQHLSADQLAILESLYGFQEEELTVEELARNLRMQRMALYQKLHRLYVKLRRDLRTGDTVL